MISFLFAAIPGIAPISKFFAVILEWFNSFTHNFTASVILLTILFRIAVLPLSIRQTKSMIVMQRIQPKLKEIQRKYKDDRERMGQEMMKLYKEHNISPLGGCLPLLVQLPLLFALFDVLHSAKEYTKGWSPAPGWGFLGVKNVTYAGSKIWAEGGYIQLIVLVLLTVVTGYISSKMMTSDSQQAKMMALMPVLFGVFAWILPAGVTIYIIVTNILTIIQQYIQLEREGFYEERRKQREKEGEPTGFLERLRYNASNTWLKAVKALGLTKAEGKSVGGAAEVARRGKAAQGKGAAKKGGPPVQKKGVQQTQKKGAGPGAQMKGAARKPGGGGAPGRAPSATKSKKKPSAKGGVQGKKSQDKK